MELANTIVTLQPGMYILRHPKTGLPPLSISRAAGKPAHNGRIEAMYTPNTDGGILRDARDCIVMQVLNAPVELLVTAYLERAGVTVPTLKIDKVSLDGEPSATDGRTIEVSAKGISIVGHIERTGDVVAGEGSWLGNPESELRIEGFQIMWPDKPEGVDLICSARAEGAGETTPVGTGHFCGTRNAMRRLVAVRFVLDGPSAKGYALSGRAAFSGGYASEIEAGVDIAGPSGLEHLTALQLAVCRHDGEPRTGAWDASARTRVVRATAPRPGIKKN